MDSSAPSLRSRPRRPDTALGVTAAVVGLLTAPVVALLGVAAFALQAWSYEEGGMLGSSLERWGLVFGAVALVQASGAVLLLCRRGWSVLAIGHLSAAVAVLVFLVAHDGINSMVTLLAVACAAALVLTVSPPVRRWATRRVTGDLAP
jgi:hypothetical protein